MWRRERPTVLSTWHQNRSAVHRHSVVKVLCAVRLCGRWQTGRCAVALWRSDRCGDQCLRQTMATARRLRKSGVKHGQFQCSFLPGSAAGALAVRTQSEPREAPRLLDLAFSATLRRHDTRTAPDTSNAKSRTKEVHSIAATYHVDRTSFLLVREAPQTAWVLRRLSSSRTLARSTFQALSLWIVLTVLHLIVSVAPQRDW